MRGKLKPNPDAHAWWHEVRKAAAQAPKYPGDESAAENRGAREALLSLAESCDARARTFEIEFESHQYKNSVAALEANVRQLECTALAAEARRRANEGASDG